MSKHVFDEAIALVDDIDSLNNTISPAYQNMVGPFGGITAATLLQSVLQHEDVKGTPVSLTANFLGPIKSSNINIRPRLVRENRSNQHWIVEAVCGAETVLTATLVFASRIDSWASTEVKMPKAPHYSELKSLPTDLLPPWAQQYDMRFVHGSPMEEADPNIPPSETLHWISDKPERPIDFASLCAICDSFFPRLFIHQREFVPFGTVTFTVYFHLTQEELNDQKTPWVLGHARASKFHGSYFDQSGEIWDEDGTLLATTHQLAYYKY